jgi:NAD+-dependent protein deacetylase sirtuin 4
MEIRTLTNLIERHIGRFSVLTGAGISTASGIPDYRGPKGTYTIQKDYQPITYQAFVSNESARQRYWARSFFGYPRISRAQPNQSHASLAALEQARVIHGIVTQNVDGLHQKAGSERVVEMHGTLGRVQCLKCGRTIARDEFQKVLRKMNEFDTVDSLQESDDKVLSTLGLNLKPIVRPDGDVDLSNQQISKFKYPSACELVKGCGHSEGILKPEVVFFGENIPETVKDKTFS